GAFRAVPVQAEPTTAHPEDRGPVDRSRRSRRYGLRVLLGRAQRVAPALHAQAPLRRAFHLPVAGGRLALPLGGGTGRLRRSTAGRPRSCRRVGSDPQVELAEASRVASGPERGRVGRASLRALLAAGLLQARRLEQLP